MWPRGQRQERNEKNEKTPDEENSLFYWMCVRMPCVEVQFNRRKIAISRKWNEHKWIIDICRRRVPLMNRHFQNCPEIWLFYFEFVVVGVFLHFHDAKNMDCRLCAVHHNERAKIHRRTLRRRCGKKKSMKMKCKNGKRNGEMERCGWRENSKCERRNEIVLNY